MTKPSAFVSLALVSLLSACGPAGKITGKVVVEGGTAGNILVRVLGPTSLGVLTDDTGNFTADKVADGAYQVIADVPNTEVETQRDTVKVANGSADKQPTLSFKAKVGKISGKVTFADMTDSSGLTVTLSGTDTRGAQTDSTGAYTFDALKAGAYLVTAEVPGTLEMRQSFSVVVGAAANPLPDMVFTWLGTLTGNVKAGTTNAPGATVNIPGTDKFAITDASGNFTIPSVPTGMTTVMARLNAATASQTVAVVKGNNTALAFTLQTALTGTVTGSIGFTGNITDTLITVSAAGTTFTTTAASNGDFSLTLPPGAWQIVADARLYPRLNMGVFAVTPGSTTRIPTARMSLYRRLPFDVGLTGVNSSGGRMACEGDIVLAWVTLSVGADQLHLVDTNLLNRRLVVANVTGATNPVLSTKCKWVAFQVPGYVVLHNVTTGEQRYIFQGTSGTVLDFSTDETVLFYNIGSNLHRYTIASGVDDIFPTTTGLVPISKDRYLTSSVAGTWSLVTPNNLLASVLSNVTTIDTFSNAAYAYTDCTAAVPSLCTLRVIGTAANTVNTYSSAQVPSTTALDYNQNSNGEFYHFHTSATASVLIKTSNATGVVMPASTQWIRYNPSVTRMTYAAPAAAQQLREEALPGTGTVVPATSSSGTFAIPPGYLSDTRIMVFDNATPRRVDIKSGTAAIDTDITTPANGAFLIRGNVATWGKASTTKRIAVLGDGADQAIDVVATQFTTAASPISFGVSPAAAFTVPKYGTVNTDPNSLFLIDANKNELRKLNGLVATQGYYANTFIASRQATGEVGFLVPAFDQYLQLNEPQVTPIALVLQPTVALSLLSLDAQVPRDLLVDRMTNQP